MVAISPRKSGLPTPTATSPGGSIAAAAGGAGGVSKMPRPSLGTKTSLIGLRNQHAAGAAAASSSSPTAARRSATPDRIASPLLSSSNHSPSGTFRSAASSTNEQTPSSTRAKSPFMPRRTLGSTPGSGTAPSTPFPSSSTRPSLAPSLAVNTNQQGQRFAEHTQSSSAKIVNAAPRRGKDLELGDEVLMEATGYTGVLRYLGPVTFKPGFYAGVELSGASTGKGKNDGSVNGVQYFACEPGNGMFSFASKVSSLSAHPPTEATARPQSALSHRSGRSSVGGNREDEQRSSSSMGSNSRHTAAAATTATPGRPRSNTASSASRPSSTASMRPSSRTSVGRPASSLSSHPRTPGANGSTATGGINRPRLQPRKSIADGLADEEGRRRAKSSAEAAEEAEGRITAGSRAYRLLQMKAQDLAPGTGTTTTSASTTTATGATQQTSPLKDSLLSGQQRKTIGGRHSLQGGLPTPSRIGGLAGRSRPSLGSSTTSTTYAMPTTTPTPKAGLKGRSSMAARTTSDMGPPVSPTKPGGRLSKEGEEKHRSLDIGHGFGEVAGDTDPSITPNTPFGPPRTNVERNRMLLEEMDLTPRRHSDLVRTSSDYNNAATNSNATSSTASSSLYSAGHGADGAEGESATTADTIEAELNGNGVDPSSVVQAVVPLALFEESSLEATRLKAELSQLREEHRQLQSTKRQQQQQQQDDDASELRRARANAEEAVRREMEEERRVEREDELRRKREWEAKQSELEKKLEDAQRESHRAVDEQKRIKQESERRAADLEARLTETTSLTDKLKATLETKSSDDDSAAASQHQKEVQAKAAEIEQLKTAVERLEGRLEESQRECDDLRDAGRETMEIYEDAQATLNREHEDQMRQFEARAQEMIVDLERQRDEANARSANGTGHLPGSAAEIDRQSLEEELSHAQRRITSLEDQLSAAQLQTDQDREASTKRRAKFTELETRLKQEIAKLKAENIRILGEKRETAARNEELNETLTETKAALESEREELEILRTEALVIGHEGSAQSAATRDKARLEAEVERINNLLEASRSGKREASRRCEELTKEVDELQSLVEEVRQHLQIAETDKALAEERLQLIEAGSTSSASLKGALESKTKELDAAVGKGNTSEQVASILEAHRKEVHIKDEEIRQLRAAVELNGGGGGGSGSIQQQQQQQQRRSSRSSLTVPMGKRDSLERSPALSANDSGVFASPPIAGALSPASPKVNGNSKRFSSASNQSRRSIGAWSSASSPEAVNKEMTGLRSIVNTLHQELTEIKVSAKTQEQTLKQSVEEHREKARKLELLVESLSKELDDAHKSSKEASEGAAATTANGQSSPSGSATSTLLAREKAAADKTVALERRVREAEEEAKTLRKRVELVEANKRQEVEKLNKDIGELEALCEATIWRREAEGLKREELERNVAKLQRKVERLLNGGSMSLSKADGVGHDESTHDSRSTFEDGSSEARTTIDTTSGPKDGAQSHGKVSNGNSMGHEDTLGKTSAAPAMGMSSAAVRKEMEEQDEPCDDCGETGHTLEECPYSKDENMLF